MAKPMNYDSDLQMFVQEPRPLNLNHLAFQRWLGEHGKLEHEIAGPPGWGVAVPTADLAPVDSYSGKA